ncbi:MAG TPA: transglycosylase SLT domain-containing protein [Myxococcota bacterium]|jgi:hypothetical protein
MTSASLGALDNEVMSAKPIERLHNDIAKLQAAERMRGHDHHELRHDDAALKKDRRSLGHDKDKYQSDKKSLSKDRDALGKLKTSEQSKLDPLDAQRAQIQSQYDASVDPVTGQGDPALQAQLDTIDSKEASVHAHFDPLQATDDKNIAALRQNAQRMQQAASAERRAIPGVRREIKHDNNAIKRDTRNVKHDRTRAHKDLEPAEFKMGLNATNHARGELGLKKVDHVIRPGEPNVVGGQVGSWIAQAQTIMKQHGIPMSKMNARDIALIIQHESSGNPNAVNNWDSNAAAGHPSEGLMQTIGPTFNEYKLAGHGKILNPVDNIIAGVRYAISRYGSISNVPGVRAVHAGGSYVGY